MSVNDNDDEFRAEITRLNRPFINHIMARYHYGGQPIFLICIRHAIISTYPERTCDECSRDRRELSVEAQRFRSAIQRQLASSLSGLPEHLSAYPFAEVFWIETTENHQV